MQSGQEVKYKISSAVLVLLSLLILFTGCSDSHYNRIIWSNPKGIFNQEIDEDVPLQSFSFLVLSDIHIGKTDNGVYWDFEAFIAWIEDFQGTAPLDFVINLGDSTQDSLEEEYQEYARFVESWQIPTHTIAGNHGVRNQERAFFRTYVNKSLTRRFSHKGISFYLIDTRYLSMGKKQLDDLFKNTASDRNVKIFCSHVPVFGGPELFYFSLSDPLERVVLINTMIQTNTALLLSGHAHYKDNLHRFKDASAELVCGSFHGRNSFFENTLPTWYVCTIYAEDKEILITRFSAEKDGSIHHSTFSPLSIGLD